MAKLTSLGLGFFLWVSAFYPRIFACGFPSLLAITRPRIPKTALSLSRGSTETLSTLDSLSDYLTRRVLQDDDPEAARLSLLNRRLEDEIVLDGRVSTGPSTIPGAGQGLFATRDLQEGELLTCYPGDALLDISTSVDSSTVTLVSWGNHVREQDQSSSLKQLDDALFGYMLTVDDEYGILGLPALSEHSAYLGHFTNDGAAILDGGADEQQAKTITQAYTLETNRKCNAKHTAVGGASHMATVAIRDIRAGEEVFVSYGPEYWTGIQNLKKSRNVERWGLGIGLGFVATGAALALLLEQH